MAIGYGESAAPTAPDTGGNLDGTNATDYYWEIPQKKVRVQAASTITSPLYIKINAATAALADWDVELTAGQTWTSEDGLLYGESTSKPISLWCADAETQRTGFSIVGWD